MTTRIGLALAALCVAASTRAAEPSLVAPSRDVPSLIAAASQPGLSPQRQAARDVLFHEITPRVISQGLPPNAEDHAALTAALSQIPCASGRPRIVRAFVQGDLAWVAVAGEKGGGCTYLLHRVAAGWAELLPIGWTLQA